MYFYVQHVTVDAQTRMHTVILDVALLSEHQKLASFLPSQTAQQGKASNSNASMLEFAYIPSGYDGLKENSWYDIDLGAFDGFEYQLVDSDEPGAAFLRARLIGATKTTNFAQYLTKPPENTVRNSNFQFEVEPNPKGPIELTVVDCGHGNWNEIKTGSDRLIYDVGASKVFTKTQIRKLVASRAIASETLPITVVLSHWDIDHYHALLEFSTLELNRLRVVVMPSQVPNTATFKRVDALLKKHQVPLIALSPAPNLTGSRTIVLKQYSQHGIFTLFRATSGRSRNQTGIVLGINGRKNIALLTGDHHYEKIIDVVTKEAAYKQRDCVLVAPHHGGNAGNSFPPPWLNFFSSITTVISCGKNTYGHPRADVNADLTLMQNGAAPIRTQVVNTWIQNL